MDSSSGPSADAQAHLEGLHTMSTTAGVTNRDYVAVNHASVAAAIFGLLGLLSFLGKIMLIFPVAAVVCAVLAWRQIGNSAGTQTGKWLAGLGLALAVFCAGGSILMEVMENIAVRTDSRNVGKAISEFGELIKQTKYAEAHALCDEGFQMRHRLEPFQRTWDLIQRERLGKLEVLEWNGVTPVFLSAQGIRFAKAKARVKFANAMEERYDIDLRQKGSRWYILSLPALFADDVKRGSKADQFNLD